MPSRPGNDIHPEGLAVGGVTATLLRERADASSTWMDRFGTRERSMLVVQSSDN